MRDDTLMERLGAVVKEHLPLPGGGETAARHKTLFAIAREDVSLAKLSEAHWDAVAILADAGRTPVPDALYAVWASEVAGKAIQVASFEGGFVLRGEKPFCSGLGLADRALVTAGEPVPSLFEVDLRANSSSLEANLDVWTVSAFASTHTGALAFHAVPVPEDGLVGSPGWYLQRPGFWHGACGPASCWAGGVAGLLDYALRSKRRDPHTLAHLGALSSNVWAMEALLAQAGAEIDQYPEDYAAAHRRALTLRHIVEQLGTDSLRRFARAYGPQPLSMNAPVARRYAEIDLFLRQAHGERDLQALGEALSSGTGNLHP